jgi:hypothetical protein
MSATTQSQGTNIRKNQVGQHSEVTQVRSSCFHQQNRKTSYHIVDQGDILEEYCLVSTVAHANTLEAKAEDHSSPV